MKRAILALAALTFAGSVLAAPIYGTSGMGAPSIPGATGVINFESQSNAAFSSLALGGVTFVGLTGNLRTDNSFANQYNGRGTRYMDNSAGQTNQIRFNFTGTLNAFAFNWGASDAQWTLTGFDAANNALESYNIPITGASNAGDFVGLAVNGMAYATLTTSSGNDWIFIDNFTIAAGGAANEIPEPGSLGLLGLGLAALAVRRRKA